MGMLFQDILITKYSTEFAHGLFSLADFNDGKGVVITSWNIPNIQEPTYKEVMLMEPDVENVYNNLQLSKTFAPYIQVLLDNTALARNYNNALSIVSYAASTNAAWQQDATTFIAWRDSVWDYAITTYNNVIAGIIPQPTIEQFIAGAPQITWSS